MDKKKGVVGRPQDLGEGRYIIMLIVGGRRYVRSFSVGDMKAGPDLDAVLLALGRPP